MSFIHMADIHAHPWRLYSKNQGEDRLQDAFSCLDQAIDLATKHGCPLVLDGDLKHVKDKWYDDVLNGYLERFEKRKCQIVIGLGNHDGVKGKKSGLEAFRKYVDVFTEPTSFGSAYFGVDAMIIPWRPTWDDLPRLVGEALQAKVKCIISHAYLLGAKLGPTDHRTGRGISVEDFGLGANSIPWGFFGDIHKQQRLTQFVGLRRGKPTVVGEVWYAGSPYAQRQDELEKDKGVLYVDFFHSPVVTPIPLQSPRFYRINLTTGKNVDQELQNMINHPQEWEGHFVELTVPPRTDPQLLQKVQETVQARAFKVRTQRPTPELVARSEIHAGLSIEEMITRYMDSKPIPADLNTKEMKTAGLQLATEQ